MTLNYLEKKKIRSHYEEGDAPADFISTVKDRVQRQAESKLLCNDLSQERLSSLVLATYKEQVVELNLVDVANLNELYIGFFQPRVFEGLEETEI